MERDPMLEALIRQKGPELEAAMREAGSPLPPGLTGQHLVQWALAEAEARAQSPEGQALFKKMQKVVEEVAAELPSGIDHPDFLGRLKDRSQNLFGDGSAASA